MDAFKLAKQMKDLQAGMKQAQAELAAASVTGTAGRGSVRVEMTGALRLKTVTIAPELFTDRPCRVEEFVAEAVNDALARAQKLATDRMRRFTGGLPGFPG